MQQINVKTKRKYFAAANSYKGFVSYFNDIFNSSDYDRIYVLKGGPGTGKSSFMKKAENYFFDKENETEAIYCSSDPDSLDGIIVARGDTKIAVLDGTAPHERDAVVPGAIDEIINLGDCWDTKLLRAVSEKISDLNNEKGEAYKTAYAYLKIAGGANEEIKKVIFRNFDKISAINSIKKLAETHFRFNDKKETRRLISSFGKRGIYRLDTIGNLSSSVLSVGGDMAHAYHYITLLADYLERSNADITNFIFALDNTLSEAVASGGVAVVYGNSDNCYTNADTFYKNNLVDNEKIKEACVIRELALKEAQRWFSIASDLHFRLEDIYSRAMYFDKINVIFDEKRCEMENIINSAD